MKVIGFDLDDTLVAEVLFLKSGIRHIAEWLSKKYDTLSPLRVISCMDAALLSRSNHYSALEKLLEESGLAEVVDMKVVVDEFRNHRPDPDIYHLPPSTFKFLSDLKESGCRLALITDGRSTTQRNKIEAAGLHGFFDDEDIIISEESGFDKTMPDNFLAIMRKYDGADEFHYFGDNPLKDVRHPSELGWEVHLTHPFPLAVHQGLPR